MDEKLVRKAGSCLTPLRFNLRGVRLSVADEFDPDIDQGNEFSAFLKYSINKHAIVQSKNKNGHLVRWYGEFGVRLAAEESEDPDEPLVSIEVDFVESYRVNEGCDTPDEECLVEFGNNNVQYHVWPYLREAVQNLSDRIGVGAIPLPHYVINFTKDSESEDA